MTGNNSPLERLLDWCADQVASLRISNTIPSTGEIDDVATLQEIEQVEADIDAVRRAITTPPTVPESVRRLAEEMRHQYFNHNNGAADARLLEWARGARSVGIMSDAFAGITAAGAQHSRTLFEINKAAGIANAIVSTHAGAAKALELGWPLGPIAAAAIIANGMAKVQAIRSQSFEGGGGAAPSTSAGGGVPAVQDVSQQGQQEQAAPRQNVTVQFMGSRSSARDARALLEELREAAGDDATLGDITFQGA